MLNVLSKCLLKRAMFLVLGQYLGLHGKRKRRDMHLSEIPLGPCTQMPKSSMHAGFLEPGGLSEAMTDPQATDLFPHPAAQVSRGTGAL